MDYKRLIDCCDAQIMTLGLALRAKDIEAWREDWETQMEVFRKAKAIFQVMADYPEEVPDNA